MLGILYIPLNFLLGCGVGFKLLFTEVKQAEMTENYGAMLGISLAGAILTMLMIRTAHKKFIFQNWVSFAMRIPTLVLIPVGVYVCNTANWYCAWCLALTVLSWVWDLTIMEDFEIDAEIKALHMKRAEVKAEKKRKRVEELRKKNKGPNALKSCLLAIPYCDNDDYAEWEEIGFSGPPDEIPPQYLPWDVITCSTESGHERVSQSIAQGKTQKIIELKDEIGKEGHEEEDANKDWLGEFTDLIFVAIIIKFADQIKYMTKTREEDDLRTRIILESMLYFYGFFVVWLEMTTEFIRFRNMPGIIDDVMRFTYMLGIITMSVQIEQKKFMIENSSGYLIGLLLCIAVQWIVHFIYYARLDRAKRYAWWRLVSYSIAILFLIIAIAAGEESKTLVVIIIIVVSSMIVFVSVNSFRVAFKPVVTDGGTFKSDHAGNIVAEEGGGRAPTDDEPFIERFGLIVMITTGESILALIVGASATFEQQYDFYLIVQLAFVTMFYMAKLYFASHTELHEGHALVEDGVPGGVCWVLCHGILAYALLFCGVGFKLLFYVMGKDYDDEYYRQILCYSLALAVVCIIMIRTAHDKFIYHHVMLLRLIPISLIIAGAYMTETLEQSYGLVFWCMLMIITLYVMDEIFLEKFEVARKYTQTLEGWRATEVNDWMGTMRFDADVIAAMSGKDGPAMMALTKGDVDNLLGKDNAAKAAQFFNKLERLKKYKPHHGHGHGHGGHGDEHGHGGHGDAGGAHSHGHGHGGVEMSSPPTE